MNTNIARTRADKIRATLASISDGMEKLPALITEAWQAGDWDDLGYPDWEAYVRAEFGTELLRFGKALRLPIEQRLAAQGMSLREIAPVVNVSKSTVANDLHVQNRTERSSRFAMSDDELRNAWDELDKIRERRIEIGIQLFLQRSYRIGCDIADEDFPWAVDRIKAFLDDGGIEGYQLDAIIAGLLHRRSVKEGLIDDEH